MQIAAAKRAYKNGPHCGDQASYWQRGSVVILCMVDGLGHGKPAEEAALAAVDYVARHHSLPLHDLFAGCDKALRRTRGVAMGIALVDQNAETLTYAGIGNTRAVIFGSGTISLRGDWGIVGAGYRKLCPETLSIHPGNLVILYTDGIKERLDFSGYHGALATDLDRFAEQILLDGGRETDDAAVLVFRNESM